MVGSVALWTAILAAVVLTIRRVMSSLIQGKPPNATEDVPDGRDEPGGMDAEEDRKGPERLQTEPAVRSEREASIAEGQEDSVEEIQ